jgi:hypothetical protein
MLCIMLIPLTTRSQIKSFVDRNKVHYTNDDCTNLDIIEHVIDQNRFSHDHVLNPSKMFFFSIRKVNCQIKVSNGSDILIIFEFVIQVYFFLNQHMVFKEKYTLAAFERIDKACHFHPIAYMRLL